MGKKPPIRVALDLETTGLHVEQDAILEVAAIKFQGTTILDRLETLVAPGRSIPYRVQRLTGITPRQLIGVPSFEAIARKLQQFVGSFPIVGHSIPFDVSFLRRQGLAYHNQLIDTFELASVLLPSLPSYSLGYVARFLGVPSSPDRHRAMADTLLAMHVFLALYERLQAIDLAALEELAHLDAPPDWPLLTFFRQELRERQREQGLQRGSIWGNLGQHFATQLGMDPRVLSFAVARAGPPLPALAPETVPLPDGHPRSQAQALTFFSPEAVPDLQILLEARRSECERQHLNNYAALQYQLQETFARCGTALVETTLGSDDYGPLLLTALEWLKNASKQTEAASRPLPRLLIVCASTQAAYRIRDSLLPRLQEQLGARFSVAYLAERDGYLCLHRWFGAAQVRVGGGPRSEEARAFAKFTLWAQETLTGERGELTLLPYEVASWERICSGSERLVASDERLGSIYERCAYRRKGYCFYQRAEERVRAAQIVVTTHAGLFDDLSSSHSLLSEIPYRLILDADLLEEEWARRSGVELSHGRLLTLLQTLGIELPNGRYQGLLALAAPALREEVAPSVATPLKLASSSMVTRTELDTRLLSWFQALRQATGAASHFFLALTHLLDEALHAPAANQSSRHERGRSQGTRNQGQTARFAERLDQALRLQRSLLNLESWDEAAHAWRQLSQRLQAVIELSQEAERLLLMGNRSRARQERPGLLSDALAAEFAMSAQRLRVLKEQGDQAFALTEGEMVYWLRVPPAPGHPQPRGLESAPAAPLVEQPLEHAPAIYGQPIQVAPMLKRLLFLPQRATILAGVALAVAGDFSFVRGRLALEMEHCPAYSLEGDRCAQTLLYIPNDVPEPNMPQYQRRLDEAILQMAEALEGQILVLFTSHAALRNSYSFIKATLETRDILLLGHGIDGSPRQLWQIFAEQPRVMLFGAGGFWEGVEELPTLPSCLFITRLPMPALNDPPLAARAEQYADQLHQMTVPVAALRLRRTLNRLAWGGRKRNSVIIFDRRLISKEYGQLILHSLPRCSQRQDSVAQMSEAVLDWLTSDGLGGQPRPDLDAERT
ncbi:exonuclease domain-containing protein [Thermogemmatispora carboxidivorans]|uniref:exonuclease domain-containing protein n=1 Tax=Thermogemmatispora carboxidivorans TaxID=1382306 RepID=UPI00069CA48E|nr:exonuclease domain-containing protein [Thermogemmatispora carboxidivorans]